MGSSEDGHALQEFDASLFLHGDVHCTVRGPRLGQEAERILCWFLR